MRFIADFAYLTSGGWKTHSMEVEAPDAVRAERTVREQMSGYSVLQMKNLVPKKVSSQVVGPPAKVGVVVVGPAKSVGSTSIKTPTSVVPVKTEKSKTL